LAQVVPGATLPFTPVPAVALEGVWPVLDTMDGPEIELLRTVCALPHCPPPPLAEVRPEQVVQ
jgi:hypothetical protein